MKFKFEPSDFHSCLTFTMQPKDAADAANAKLASWLKDAMVVYGSEGNEFWAHTKERMPKGKHKALLINIEPLDRCKHEASKITERNSTFGYHGHCYVCECGARVVPNSFTEVKE